MVDVPTHQSFYRRNAITRREFYGGKVVGESAIKKDTEAGHVIKHRFYVSNFTEFMIGNMRTRMQGHFI